MKGNCEFLRFPSVGMRLLIVGLRQSGVREWGVVIAGLVIRN
jgi:hypothetical protein